MDDTHVHPGEQFLDNLKAELDRTAVISESFKNVIFGLASNAVYEAYHRGAADGTKQAS